MFIPTLSDDVWPQLGWKQVLQSCGTHIIQHAWVKEWRSHRVELHPVKFNGKPRPSVPAPTPQSQNKMTSCYPESLQDSTHGLNPNQATQAAHIFNYTHKHFTVPNEWLLLFKNPVSRGLQKYYILNFGLAKKSSRPLSPPSPRPPPRTARETSLVQRNSIHDCDNRVPFENPHDTSVYFYCFIYTHPALDQ